MLVLCGLISSYTREVSLKAAGYEDATLTEQSVGRDIAFTPQLSTLMRIKDARSLSLRHID